MIKTIRLRPALPVLVAVLLLAAAGVLTFVHSSASSAKSPPRIAANPLPAIQLPASSGFGLIGGGGGGERGEARGNGGLSGGFSGPGGCFLAAG